MRGCETITAADELSGRMQPPRGAIVERLYDYGRGKKRLYCYG